MLFFIGCVSFNASSASVFKYISCYSLSGNEHGYRFCELHSNTSHVILYRYTEYLVPIYLINSNTSHVILYLIRMTCAVLLVWFKYISCYSLSLWLFQCWFIMHIFKYISCYSLSLCLKHFRFKTFIQIHLMLFFIMYAGNETPEYYEFKYISCYSLSHISFHFAFLIYNSNTSHVILYPVFLYASDIF